MILTDRNQIILINKPYRWTSFDVVKKIRSAFLKKLRAESSDEKVRFKVGHAGTLDPLATGLLILCTGNKTKDIGRIQDAEKEYTGSIHMGVFSESYDYERELIKHEDIAELDPAKVEEVRMSFLGEQFQIPPMHSAIKVEGKRAYELARQGNELELKARRIEIKEFEILGIELLQIHFRIVCSKGTYIRSLADDFGKRMGSRACLSSLSRTRIGEYLLTDAFQPSEFINQLSEYQSN
ncbi:MAG: tRNA pseudouridine(55) synthase TruB [Bacteroidetes bacterium]|nr:MAG: tRNA pseudouridine(55) synthase TruB [Bacteroidota bacterium]REK05323.1 MAG: tRNA pseudouridine(55) synthase TruB [Bacteroidota bacterium]REK36392.1 MAG: tRNA pseudouridine(55) synthase TruB [Bacteroidota bacterium]REK51130.1 MAG: tRNA pseudouridine(55) synthase TruB [Bacteroidota bacterium]